jgi:murein DD-endopeptidase MepM/ murein hydrolase activator NlpD
VNHRIGLVASRVAASRPMTSRPMTSRPIGSRPGASPTSASRLATLRPITSRPITSRMTAWRLGVSRRVALRVWGRSSVLAVVVVLVGAVAAGCSGGGDPTPGGGAAPGPGTGAPSVSTTTGSAPAATSTSTTSGTAGSAGSDRTAGSTAGDRGGGAGVAVRYRFPVGGCRARYGRSHHDYPAADMFTGRGCAFVAPVNGRVDEVSRRDLWDPARDRGADRGGRSVSVVAVDGVRYYGSHLEAVAPGIVPGARVRAGELLGRIGNSGSARVTAVHLHFAISWPTRPGIWWVRRGMIQPAPYLDSWRAGGDLSPVRAVRAARAEAGREVPACQARC